MSRRFGALVIALAAVSALAGCTAPPAEVGPSKTAGPVPDAAGNGILVVGTLFSTRVDVAAPARIAGVELAVREINEAGGVLDAPVVVLHRDAGEPTEDRLEQAFADLAARGVDVVLAPADASLLERVTVLADAAGVAVISQPAESVPVAEEFAARVLSMDPGVRDATSATEAYDAVVFAALAATLADDDSAASIAHFAGVLADGSTECGSFGECTHTLTERDDIVYVGASGEVALEGPDAAKPTASPEG